MGLLLLTCLDAVIWHILGYQPGVCAAASLSKPRFQDALEPPAKPCRQQQFNSEGI